MSSSDPQNASAAVSRSFSRRFQIDLVIEGALVGLFGGGVVTLYRLSLSGAEELLRQVTGSIAGNLLYMALWFLFLAVLLLLVGKLMTWEPATAGSGIPQVDAEVIGHMDAPWHRVILAKFIEGSAVALAGLSMGREGPSVQLGGMSGKAVSRLFGRKRGEERLLVTCGAAAGMSAAFHAPLTGVLFAIEEIHREFTASLIISVMASSLTADYLVSGVLGVAPVMSLDFLRDLPHADYPYVVALGIVCGILGALHNRGMFACQSAYKHISKGTPYMRLVIPFALAGVAAFAWPELMCGGDAVFEAITSPTMMGLAPLIVLLLGKYAFTTVSFGSGAPGGTLFPLVVMGALVGCCFSRAAGIVSGFDLAYYPNFMALGIAGLFAAVVRAPVTGCVLVFELTGSLDAMLSVSLVSILAYIVANLTKTDPFYEHLLAAQLDVSEDSVEVTGLTGEKVLKTFHVGAGCRIEGMTVAEVPWPDATRVILINRASAELIPIGTTRIEALDDLLMIMDTDAEEDVTMKLEVMTRPAVKR
ncbi:ClC family H(+)/Cl(-) exchange transporter [Paratractidigestivibacter sp.]|uniref:ClC family H(+)/Cl(-) exchange transporter n=1 Tax=Paratractidigestivibacter sp. TaxID=2847316 RepID=UPI002ABD212F|nr:ClC family H(+)/Cl(-) exchange transporter [Paratractidigestivibacter sp.]